MALTTAQTREAKALNKHQADALISEALDLERKLEAIRKENDLDKIEKRLATIKDMIGIVTGKVTTDFFNNRVVYGAESERVSIPTAVAKDLLVNDPEEFARLKGEVKTVKGSFLRFEAK